VGEGPLVAAAIHDGHLIRSDLNQILNLGEKGRLTEEDPYTGLWTSVGNSRIIVNTSRFEVDLNRPRDKAVYLNPEDAWGLNVWKSSLSDLQLQESLDKYDRFYSEVRSLFEDIEKNCDKFFVYDIHTYNHMRDGETGTPADPGTNPEVNIGTGNLNREKWESLVDRFINDLSSFNFNGKKLDVRENVKFKGGHFSKWTGENFPESSCCIAIEFKKFFMNEWTGTPDIKQIELIKMALQSTSLGVIEELEKAGARF
jgi:N-formylglutamate amidohydrolase